MKTTLLLAGSLALATQAQAFENRGPAAQDRLVLAQPAATATWSDRIPNTETVMDVARIELRITGVSGT